ncbi:fumarylacetoacetate hydrolase family protein [Aliidiomarina sanyensis]|uniref:Isomerase/hydrolase n=1 Tax=Aliidiomarina sanyensis TaxID=1249555 RepID=A0A432WNK5_9GAMM|nr:fumarylacetoacetate hydrolase family protein [Aliidiomarina sanyensis]RUO35331.1 isomerase/hydrolase [Aliidiomarina sanyensis]
MSTPLYWIHGAQTPFALGQFVCVGRNYADHAKELGNTVPEAPILFMKPPTAYQPLRRAEVSTVVVPSSGGACHHELELALLIGRPLGPELIQHIPKDKPDALLATIAGVGLALDLTRRDVQDQLKAKGHPWERAKAFAGSCPLTEFVPTSQAGDLKRLRFRLVRNAQLQQEGHVGSMIFSIAELLREIASVFRLQPGDVVLTGTPAGVGPLEHGDALDLELTTSDFNVFGWQALVQSRSHFG